jgi:acyl-CoA synthetase (AMP-forming)/AMP-acid ligase II
MKMIFGLDSDDRRNRIALIDGDGGISWTYAQLADQVSRRRDLLATRKKSLLFLFCRNDLTSVAWYLAALEAEQPVALLNEQIDVQLRGNLISLYQPECILSSEADGTSESAGLWRHRTDSTSLHPALALLLSTSGSTGSPKFVRLTRGNVEANAGSIRQALCITERDVPVAHLPLHYSYGLSVLNSHLLAGASILLTRSGLMSPNFWEAIRRYRADSFSGVPYTYQMLRRLGLDQVNAPTLRVMTQAGGKLDTENIAYFHSRMMERNGAFWVMYGQTEATARIAILPSNELPRKLGSAGRVIPGGALSIFSENGEAAAGPHTEGELIYTGPNVMLGYASKRADLAKGDELKGRLYTGDRASLDAEDFVYILGRAKRDTKLFGLRVNLDELEAFVKLHGPAGVVAGSNRVVIFCEFGTKSSHAQICDALSARVKIHRSAFDFRRIDRLPTKDNGKINYEELSTQA